MNLNSIYVGDVLDVLKTLPSESIDCVITSPPYWGQRNYGTAVWSGGEETCSHEAARIKNRFDYSLGGIQKQYNKSNVVSYDNTCLTCGAVRSDNQLGRESTYNDYLVNLINVFSEIRRVVKDTGSVWVNLGDVYASKNIVNNTAGVTTTRKSQIQIPTRFSIRMTDDLEYILRNTIIWHKPNVFPSSTKDRFTHDFEYFFFFTKNQKYYFEQQFEPLAESSIARADYGWKGKKLLDGESWNGLKHMEKMGRRFAPSKGRNKRAVWTIPNAGAEAVSTGEHVAPYPERLIETPILACCPIGGVVLDPFMGSGTTGAVAKSLGRNFVGIDLNENYAEAAMRRIDNTQVRLC